MSGKKRRESIRALLAEVHPDALKLRNAKRKAKALASQLREAHNREERLREQLDLVLDVTAADTTPAALEPRKTKSHREGVLVALASDWHVGERVDAAEVHDRNEFNPEVAETRVREFARGIAWLLRLFRSEYSIERVVVALLGDLITGYLHDDQRLNNTITPTEEVLLVIRLVRGLIDHLLEQGVEVSVPCHHGNHGRITAKPLAGRAAAHSYETMLYRLLAQVYEQDERVSFAIADGHLSYQDILGLRIRWTHGDSVRYQGGIRGPGVPLRKKVDAWDKEQTADLTVMGHLHTWRSGPDWVINGTLAGYTPYGRSRGFAYEPPIQGAFLVDRDWGWGMSRGIYVDPRYGPLRAAR